MTGGRRLDGRRILVTRAAEQAPELTQRLHALGAVVIEVPAIAIQPIAGPDEVRGAAARLRGRPPPRWLAVTSTNSVRALTALDLPRDLEQVHVAAVADVSATALRQLGVAVDLVAARSTAASLGADLVAAGAGAGAVWLPQAEAARLDLAQRLRDSGASVDVTICYRSIAPAGLAERLDAALAARVDAITLLSGGAADNLIGAVGAEALEGIPLVCIGPVTAAAVGARGLSPITARHASAEAVADAVVEALGPAAPRSPELATLTPTWHFPSNDLVACGARRRCAVSPARPGWGRRT